LSNCQDNSIKFQDRLTAALIVIVLLFTVAVILKIAKKEIVVNDIVELNIEEIYIEELPPLQGEVNE
jgi:uncharacterized protein Smg (DUF494 family)